MRANNTFQRQSKEFWANIRLISQQVGYTERGKGTIKIPTKDEVINILEEFHNNYEFSPNF